jgi:hypothetical protein
VLLILTDGKFPQAYQVCNERDLVLEMVFLLGRMGNSKQALTLIIERLGDVNRVNTCATSLCAMFEASFAGN